jgi:uncharacterized protein YegL
VPSVADIDYGEAWDFIDELGRPLRLRFRRNWGSGDRHTFDGTGQLLAVIDDQHRSDNGDPIAISRPDVLLVAVNEALDGWQKWANLAGDDFHRLISLKQIQRRINEAGLGVQ